MFRKFGMMKGLLFSLLISLLIVSTITAGEWDADSLVRSIPPRVTHSPGLFASYLETTFPTDEERVKALYIWLAKEIDYDVRKSTSPIRIESLNKLVDATLSTRRAVCQGYAEVFRNICNRLGIKTFTVHGYTRMDGKNKFDLGHAWNATRIDGEWYLFDPTWGSGYVNDGRYYKSFSWNFYKAHPDSLLSTHMPFDPIWQLKSYPITHPEFLAGEKSGEQFFNFADTLELFCTLGKLERAEESLRRAKSIHVDIRELTRVYRKFSSYISNIRSNYYIDIYNNAVHAMHAAVDYFNDFQSQKGKHRNDPGYLHKLLASSRSMAELARQKMTQIEPGVYMTAGEIRSIQKDIRSLEEAISFELKQLR